METGEILASAFFYGGWACAAYGVLQALRIAAAGRWPAVRGTVERSEIVVEQLERSRVYVAKILYAYSVGGRSFVGQRVMFPGDFWTSFRSKAEEACAAFPKGASVQVRYDPNDPVQSYLRISYARTAGLIAACVGVSLAARAYLNGTL